MVDLDPVCDTVNRSLKAGVLLQTVLDLYKSRGCTKVVDPLLVGMEGSSTVTFSIWQEDEQAMPIQDVGQLPLQEFAKMYTVSLLLLT